MVQPVVKLNNLLLMLSKYNLDIKFIIVNEAGASVYSASEIARSEFPNFSS